MDSVLVLRKTWTELLEIRRNAINQIKQLLIDAGFNPKYQLTENNDWLWNVAKSIFDTYGITISRFEFSNALANPNNESSIENLIKSVFENLRTAGFLVLESNEYVYQRDTWPQGDHLTKMEVIRGKLIDFESRILMLNQYKDALESLLYSACVNNIVDFPVWEKHIESKHVDIHFQKDILFRTACGKGYFTLAQWLHKVGADIHVNNDEAFRLSCEHGHFELAQWLHSIGANIHVENDQAFRYSCERGHLEIAKWLYSLGANVHARNDDAFILSCFHGHLEIAKWLYTVGADVHVKNDEAFRWCCYYGNLRMAQWLYSLGNVDIHAKNDEAFQMSCQKGHFEIAKWLYDLGNVNIRANTDSAFKMSCSTNQIEIVQWLQSKYELYEIQIENERIVYWQIRKEPVQIIIL